MTPAGTLNSVDITPAGTIGTHSLTVAELPAHSHGRGTQDIKGTASICASINLNTFVGAWLASGCFNNNDPASGNGNFVINPKTDAGLTNARQLNFKASNNWSGVSESKGSGTAHGHLWTGTKNTHNHTFTGTANTFSLLNPYKVAYCFIRIA